MTHSNTHQKKRSGVKPIEQLKPGKYLVAVSGGVDSMVLIDILLQQPGLELGIAHVNHGIRVDAGEDETLVGKYATEHSLPFFSTKLSLGPGASEAAARFARYAFLRACILQHSYDALITAHHYDDVLETALINLIRGTGWRGMTALKSTNHVIRPLLGWTKEDIYSYAKQHQLTWREDSTNTDTQYLRNYLRHEVVPKSKASLKTIETLIEKQKSSEAELRSILQTVVNSVRDKEGISRYKFIMLPHDVACEVARELLDELQPKPEISQKTIERMVCFIKTALPGKNFDLGTSWKLQSKARSVLFVKNS